MLYACEEYELVFTVNPDKIEDCREALRRAGGELIQIGKVTRSKRIMLRTEERLKLIRPAGWDHFKSGP